MVEMVQVLGGRVQIMVIIYIGVSRMTRQGDIRQSDRQAQLSQGQAGQATGRAGTQVGTCGIICMVSVGGLE